MSQQKTLRFCYLGGLGDALDVYNAWTTGATLEYFGTNYLKQFFQVCKDFKAEGFVILASPGEYSCHNVPGFTLEHRPPPSHAGLSGIRYHLAFNVWMFKIVLRMLRFRPDVFVVTAGIAYCLPLSILKLFGVRIIPAIHDSLWRRFSKLKLSSRIIRRSQAWFFRCCASEFLVAAESTAAQVRSLIPKKNIRIEIFLPNYSKEQFSSIREPNYDLRPFRVLFMGRIEINKGVYDLLEVAGNLEADKFHFDMCGVGSESNSLQRAIDARDLAGAVTYHGFLNRKDLGKLWDDAHIVIVPTTTDFEEGFNMVCSEAILAGRPVVTSEVCPALAYIRNAALEVRPNDIDGYRKAVIALASDSALYHEKQAACTPLQGQFYEEKNSYGAKLTAILQGLSLGKNDRKPEPMA
jgi:glycogen(starch) synthase